MQSTLMLLFSASLLIWYFYKRYNLYKNEKKSEDFENRMENLGFTKSIVVFDFLSDFRKRMLIRGRYSHLWRVGIWFDYQKRVVALRTDGNTWKEIIIPFEKIQTVEINGKGYSKIRGAVIGPFINVGLKEISQGLQIRIVTGDMNTGTSSLYLILYDAKTHGGKLSESNDRYKSIEECARSIVDEIENIIRYTG